MADKKKTGPEITAEFKRRHQSAMNVRNLIQRIIEASGAEKNREPVPLQLSAEDCVLLVKILQSFTGVKS